MIRFSAALVAVAIGVLIGGIATSELLLVYIAIVVSAVALVVLTIGIVLNRAELFGEGQGLVPAGAGASPVVPVRTGASHAEVLSSAHVVPPPPSQGAAVGYAAPFGVTAAVATATASAAADLTATRPAAAGQGRSADWVPPWETTAAREPWSSQAPDTRRERMPAAQDERTATAAGSADIRTPSAWQNRTPGAALGGWVVPDAVAQAAATAPKQWAARFSGLPDAPEVKPSAGSGAKPPSWFDRLGNPTGAEAPASEAARGRSWSSRDNAAAEDTATADTVGPATSADATASVDDGDDWPARYSWLEDETDETDESSEVGNDEADEAVAADASIDAPTRDAGSRDAVASDPAIDVAEPGSATQHSPTSDPDPAPEAEVVGEPEAGIEPRAGSEPIPDASEPPADASAGAPAEISLVTVIPGVPRYHDPDCVLVRFMTDDDIKKQSVAQAKEAGCTPCGACLPEG